MIPAEYSANFDKLNSLENKKNDTWVNNNWVESLHDLSYQYILSQSWLRKETVDIYFRGGWYCHFTGNLNINVDTGRQFLPREKQAGA